jgi:NAD(P)-dependent dehydrogenase (short-subunit alcohol dehydrogenase family)
MPESKTALVTGGNRGIGFEICRQLAEKGFKVFLTARNKEAAKKALEKLAAQNLIVNFVPLDVTNYKSVQYAVELFKEQSSNLDVLINNAAILRDKTNIFNMPENLLSETLQTNVIGAFWVTQAFVQLMKKGGRIINISSDAGQLSRESTYSPAYSISKTALNAVTKQFASALSPKGIAVNSVHPGWIKTDMGGSSAPSPIEKGAETTLWLATEVPIDVTSKFFYNKKEFAW